MEFGTFDFTKDDLIRLEKLILRGVTLTERSDHSVILGKSNDWLAAAKCIYSSARYIPDEPRVYHYAEIRVKAPNVLVIFGLRATDVYVVREFYKGDVLQQQSKVAEDIRQYLHNKDKHASRSMLGKLFHRNTIRIAC